MKQRIAFISEHASPLHALGSIDSGGQNVYVDKLARYLSTLGYSVDIFTRRTDNSPEVIEYAPGVRAIHINAGPVTAVPKEHLLPFMHEFKAEMLKFFARHGSDYRLIHAHFFMSGLVAAEIKKELRIPFVITFHALGKVRRAYQGANDGFSDERFAIEERVVKEADAIIAECPQDRQDLLAHYNAPQERISIVPCGFDAREFYPLETKHARKVLGLDPNEKIILQLGRMVPRKGVETVVRAVAELKRKLRLPVRLLIVGGESEDPDPVRTPEIGRLTKIADELRISQNVQFVGRRDRDQLKYFYNASDVFVTTPWYEPFGITPLEAMACGVPVIGSRVGGIQYSVAHEESGLLVEPQDPHVLALALERIFTDSTLYSEMKSSALLRAESLFTWDKVAREMKSVYDRLLDAEESHDNAEHEFAGMYLKKLEEAAARSRRSLTSAISESARVLLEALRAGGKILVCGNGGSAVEAQHFAAELVGRFLSNKRRALPAIALTSDGAILTAIGNDFGFNEIFSRQIEALGKKDDVILGISTSGRSPNLIAAFKAAARQGMRSVALIGKDGGELQRHADLSIVVPSDDTQSIQEIHMNVIHTLCSIIENAYAAPKDEKWVKGLWHEMRV